jgi:pyruvate/2-oxoglutarate dehydrogenase complex dihydrolipoamide acyltransferase (E2) component
MREVLKGRPVRDFTVPPEAELAPGGAFGICYKAGTVGTGLSEVIAETGTDENFLREDFESAEEMPVADDEPGGGFLDRVFSGRPADRRPASPARSGPGGGASGGYGGGYEAPSEDAAPAPPAVPASQPQPTPASRPAASAPAPVPQPAAAPAPVPQPAAAPAVSGPGSSGQGGSGRPLPRYGDEDGEETLPAYGDD